MGSLPFEKEMLSPLDYVTLGVKDTTHDYLGKPLVLSLVATLLERAVDKNERMLEATPTTKDGDVITTIFHGSRPPSLTIRQYIDRIFKYSCCSPSCFVIAHMYVDRFIRNTNLFLTSLNVHRLVITGVMVAAKFMDDSFFNNAYYARVGGVSTAELNRLELKFLFGLDFRLHVSVESFRKYCSVLKRESASGLVERPLQACGTNENWKNKDDSSSICPHSITR